MRLPIWIIRPVRRLVLSYIERRNPDFVIGNPADSYMDRWHILRTPFFRLYLHVIKRSDDDRALHDHPSWNLSVLLSGSYTEITSHDGSVYLDRTAGDVVFRPAVKPHRLVVSDAHGAVTLWFRGPKIREWGFWPDMGHRWVPWFEFCDPLNKGLHREL